jgi:hypothetical protein
MKQYALLKHVEAKTTSVCKDIDWRNEKPNKTSTEIAAINKSIKNNISNKLFSQTLGMN